MRIKSLTLALLASCFVLASCNKYAAEADKRIETTLARVEEYREMAEIPDLPEPMDTVRVQNDIWLGANSTKIMEGEALPSWVEKEDGITMVISKEAKLTEIVQEISDMTGITIRMDDLKDENAVPEDAVPVKYSGKLSGLLNYLSNRYGIYWRYKDDVITFFTQETRVFTVYALPTETSMQASLTGATMGESGGGNASSSLSVNTDLKIWDSIEEGVKQVVGENGKLSFSRVAGTVTVTANPYIVKKVAAYIANWNEKLSRQVAVTVRILQVTLTNSDSYGLDLGLAFGSKNISTSWASQTGTAATNLLAGVAASPTAGSLAMTLIKPSSKFNNSQAIIKAISTQGKTQLVTTSTVTTLNNKVAPVQISTSKNYLKEITTTTTGSSDDRSTDVDYDVETLNYGFTMEILPRILDHGRLIVLFNLSITDLLKLDEFNVNSGSGSSTTDDSSSSDDDDDDDDSESESVSLQMPTMRMRGFVQEIAMRSGQTLILTGFEDLNEATSTSGVGKAKVGLLGGNADNEATRNVLVILMTPEVLQSPLSPEALMRDY